MDAVAGKRGGEELVASAIGFFYVNIYVELKK